MLIRSTAHLLLVAGPRRFELCLRRSVSNPRRQCRALPKCSIRVSFGDLSGRGSDSCCYGYGDRLPGIEGEEIRQGRRLGKLRALMSSCNYERSYMTSCNETSYMVPRTVVVLCVVTWCRPVLPVYCLLSTVYDRKRQKLRQFDFSIKKNF